MLRFEILRCAQNDGCCAQGDRPSDLDLMFAIGIDIGGTSIRAAAIDSIGRVLSSRRAPTPRDGDDFRDWIVHAVHHIREDTANQTATAVGLALPGIVDTERGMVIRSVNLPFLEGRLLRDELSKNTGLAVRLMTDADAATWGEYSACAPRPKAFVHLRLGTGVACGIVVEDRLQPTDPDRTTHWKVLVVDDRPEAISCPCGLRGCLEAIASGPVLERQAARIGFDNGLDTLQQAWERNEPTARTIIDTVANATASAICNLKSQIPNGAVVCLGGGVITALPCLLEQTAKHLRSLDDDFARRAALCQSRLGDDAGVIGAAMLARV
jgi:glucokinase